VWLKYYMIIIMLLGLTIVFLRSNIFPKLYIVRCRQKLGLSLARGTIRAQASNISVGPGDYGSNNEKDSQNVSERNSVDDSSSKMWVSVIDFVCLFQWLPFRPLHVLVRWPSSLGTCQDLTLVGIMNAFMIITSCETLIFEFKLVTFNICIVEQLMLLSYWSLASVVTLEFWS